MQIIGNVKTADKFYIIKNSGGIEYVPSLAVAKSYINNPQNIEWYRKDIYATNEELAIDHNGTLNLKSKIKVLEKTINSQIEYDTFKQQANIYSKDMLLIFAKYYTYDNIDEMIILSLSKIPELQKLGKLAIKYKDACYIYLQDKFKDFIENQPKDEIELELKYTTFRENFPKYEK